MCGLAALLCAVAPLAAPLADAQTPPPPPPLTDRNAYVLPAAVAGVQSPSILLNGTWQFQFSPDGKWADILVPSEVAMQGFAIKHDTPYRYKTTVHVPADFAGKRVFLRFDGVYSYARLFVNGALSRDHHGGFTRWEADITQHVKTGEKNEIQLEITDRIDEISFGSGYAHHPIGGILRDVYLFALPETHFFDFYTETQLDAEYKDAVLKIKYAVASPAASATVEYTLTEPSGAKVALPQNVFPLTPDHKGVREDKISLKNPLKWDAEHPNLYTLTVALKNGNKEISRFVKKVGFREIKVEKDKLLVNGKAVKWRGAARHDNHPKFGRMTTAEVDAQDAQLFKEANMNYVRTSHYPPSEHFVECCDALGIYVECETAVCFAGANLTKDYPRTNSHIKPVFKERYLAQFQEMVKTFRGHPSVALWSLGNESAYASNFQHCYDWLKTVENARPVIFSYPDTVRGKNKIFNIHSFHYPTIHGETLDLNGRKLNHYQGRIPVLFDEWAHVACYTFNTLRYDPNIRETWEQSLDKMWKATFASPTALGGAIWGFVDETFALPFPKEGTRYWFGFDQGIIRDIKGNCAGYGEWGIVDVWRRKKPEFWSTKKAYSPIKLLTTTLTDFRSGEKINIPIENRFDHTNLSEVKIFCSYNGEKFYLPAISIEPHKKGTLTLPAKNWKEGAAVSIAFYSAKDELIDMEKVTIGKEKINFPEARGTAPLQVTEDADKVVFKGDVFEVSFDKKTGLLNGVFADGKKIIEGGPFLNLDINKTHTSVDSDWKKTAFAWELKDGGAEVKLDGTSGKIGVKIKIKISPSGKVVFDFQTTGEPKGNLRESGLKFYLPDWAGELRWKRNAYWTCYDENSISAGEGTASLEKSKKPPYGEKPKTSWREDAHNYFYWGDAGANSKNPLSNIAKAMKENVWYYQLVSRSDAVGAVKSASGLAVVSANASLACRLDRRPDGQLILYTNSRWSYPESAQFGNYNRNLPASPNIGTLTLILVSGSHAP
jgi:hypothetical protein